MTIDASFHEVMFAALGPVMLLAPGMLCTSLTHFAMALPFARRTFTKLRPQIGTAVLLLVPMLMLAVVLCMMSSMPGSARIAVFVMAALTSALMFKWKSSSDHIRAWLLTITLALSGYLIAPSIGRLEGIIMWATGPRVLLTAVGSDGAAIELRGRLLLRRSDTWFVWDVKARKTIAFPSDRVVRAEIESAEDQEE